METIIKKCKCGREFKYPTWKNRKFCSHQCSVKYMKPHKALFKKGMVPWNKGKKSLKKSYRKGKTWVDIWGENEANKMKNHLRKKKYKGVISIDKKGYFRKRSPTTGKIIPIHQKVWMDNNLGYIPKGYCIHHLDGNKQNNNIKNLILLDFGTHTRVHLTGRKHTKETKKKMSKTYWVKRRNK